MTIEDKTVLAENSSVKTAHRKKTRKFLYQKLYAATFAKVDNAHFDEAFYTDVFDFDVDTKYLEEMYTLVLEKESYLMFIITQLAPKFKLESMWMSYIIPILIGACEMIYLEEEIPAKVSINESVEMAKVYWDDSSKKIVNGVMNKLYKGFDDMQKSLETFDWKSDFTLFKS